MLRYRIKIKRCFARDIGNDNRAYLKDKMTLIGAGGGTRTLTPFLAPDFESVKIVLYPV